MTLALHRLCAISIATLLSFLAGCANLGAIQEFGKLSADSAGYTKLTDDYLAGPSNQKKYTLTSEADKRAELDRLSKERAKQADQLGLYHKTVESYMKALSDLAGDQVISYDKELGGLIDAASGASIIPKDKVDAAKSISELLAEAATDLYRQKRLREVIGRANAPLQNVLRDMIQIVKGYDASIENERAAFTDYYRYLVATASEEKPKGSGAREPAAAQIISDAFTQQGPSFDDRGKAVTAYVKTLQAIADAHQSLYDNRDKLSDDSVQVIVKSYSTQIYKAYKTVRK